MKKIKLLTPLATITTLVASSLPIITSCSNKQTQHIKIDDSSKKQTAKDGSAYYFIILDNDKYKADEFSIKPISTNNQDISDLFFKPTLSNNILIVQTKVLKSYDQETTYNFNLEVKSNTWTEKLYNFKLIVPADIFDGRVTPAQWANAIDLLIAKNENFTTDGIYTYTNPDTTKSYQYTFTNKYNASQSEQTLVGHPILKSQTIYMDKRYDVYWTYYKQLNNWLAGYPYIEKFGFDDFYYFIALLSELRNMEESGMEFVSSEPGGIGYYYGSTTYGQWAIEFGFRFNKDKVIEKSEIKATKGDEIKDTVATYSNYKTTSFTIPQEVYSAQYERLKEIEYNTEKEKFITRTGYIYQDYYVLPFKYTDDMPQTTTISHLRGFRGGYEQLKLKFENAYAFVNGVMQEATISDYVATFANPITLTKGSSTTVTFVIWMDAGRPESDIEIY